jgi:hypothetical protein
LRKRAEILPARLEEIVMGTQLFGIVAMAGLALSSCALEGSALSTEQGTGAKKPAAKKPAADGPTPPTTDLVTMRDPVEDMFSIGMPKGWANRVYSVRIYDINTMVVTSISPNGSVILFAGDPSMPQFWSPGNPVATQMAQFNKMVKIQSFVPAPTFLPAYVERKFGRLPGFKVTNTSEDFEYEEKLQKKLDETGVPMRATAAKVDFTYQDAGAPRNVRILGSTCNAGGFWTVSVSGVSTTSDPDRYIPMMETIGKSHKMNPAWQAREQERHREAMAAIQRATQEMTNRHNANMAWIQDSARRHQARMDAIHAQGAASTRAFEQRMSAMDSSQRSFLNYINDESTVVNSSGKTFQVDNSYQRYYINKTTGTYVGGDIRLDHDKLRDLGLNPDDYEEAKPWK